MVGVGGEVVLVAGGEVGEGDDICPKEKQYELREEEKAKEERKEMGVVHIKKRSEGRLEIRAVKLKKKKRKKKKKNTKSIICKAVV